MYKRTSTTGLKHFDFYILDLILLAVSYAIGYVLRFGFTLVPWLEDVVVRFGVILLIVYLLVAIISRAYKDILHRSKWTEILSVFIQIAITAVFYLLFLYVTKQSDILPRLMFGYTAAAAFVLISICRILYKNVLRKHFRNNSKLPHMLIIADEDHAKYCIDSIMNRRFNEFYISGLIVRDKDMCGEEVSGVKVVANYKGMKEYVMANVVDQIFISIANEDERQILAQYFLEAGITVHISLVDNVILLPNVVTGEIGGQMVLTTSNSTSSGWQLAVKRAFDIFGGFIGLIFTGIVYLIVAPQIKAKDPGPAFFKQLRVGKNGRQFYIYKFRSMYMDAEERKKELMAMNEMDGLMFKMENDPRILPGIGHFIRKWSLDEFPQFWNVFKGDMSLVGTRPPTVEEFSHYEVHHKARLSFKPGLTGMWQVSGRSDITDFEEIVNLDNEYIRKWNLLLDVKILFKTVAVVLGRKGSK